MALGLGRPSLDNGSPEITPQQERSLAVEQNTANLGNIERQLDSKLENKDVFNGYPEEVKGILKDALMKECYVQFGNNPNITSVDSFYDFKNSEHLINLTIDRVLDIEIKPLEILENHKLNNDPSFDLEGLKVSIKADAVEIKAAQEELKFNDNKEVLSEAFSKALQYRSDFMADRNEEIKNTSLWDKIRGKAPDPIPSVAEVSLSKEEILRHVPPSHRGDEQFLKMADAMVERLGNSSLQYSEIFKVDDNRLSGQEIDHLIKDMPYDELMHKDMDFKIRALLKVEGIPEDDLMKVLNMQDVKIQEDLTDMILTINHVTDEMTEHGQRLEWTMGNNTYGVFNSDIKDCNGQSEHVISKLNDMYFNNEWTFGQQVGSNHTWGLALPSSPDKPYLSYDPRARSFGVNRRCDSCSSWSESSTFQTRSNDIVVNNGALPRGDITWYNIEQEFRQSAGDDISEKAIKMSLEPYLPKIKENL